jgi:hypothetical protein
MYLPSSTVDSIAEILALPYDAQTDHYLINDETHQRLLKWRPELTFEFASNFSSKDTVVISLPYSSLGLQLGSPSSKTGNETRYFPIRKITKPEQSVLGRTFLQNAYLIADYDRRSFSVHQVRFSDFPPDIRKIGSGTTGNTLDTWDSDSKDRLSTQSRGLSAGAIAGIVSGSIVSALFVAVMLGLCWRRSQRLNPRVQTQDEDTKSAELDSKLPHNIHEADSDTIKLEMLGDSPPSEMPDSKGGFSGLYSHVELDSDAEKVMHELEGSPIFEGSKVLADQKTDRPQQLTVAQSDATEPIPASPIPKTPLEFYRPKLPETSPVESELPSEANGTGAPRLQLIPPSPVVSSDNETKG